jgi:TetR/AcrR family tetracycline transcriptional repressor
MAQSGMKLDRSLIIDAAFAVLNAEGLDGLSLRLVAGRLGVQAPALYWHVHNKAELIGLMAATFSTAAEQAAPHAEGWQARLIAFGRVMRQTMLQHRDAARLCVVAQPIERPEISASRLAAPLVAAGLDRRRALSYQASVIAYTVGWVVYEQSQTMHDYLAQMIDFPASFDTGLCAMVHGFASS